MNFNSIATALERNRGQGYERNSLYSVLIPLIEINGELHVLFEIRSYDLLNQPGEVCFPGGKMESGEKPSETAMRETMEELNLSSNQLKIIGSLPPLTTPFHFTLFPFCGVIQHISYDQIRYSADEVDSIFTIRLQTLLEQKPDEYTLRYQMMMDPEFPYHHIPNGKSYDWKEGSYQVIFYYHTEFVIWGLTAKILKFFLESIRNEV